MLRRLRWIALIAAGLVVVAFTALVVLAKVYDAEAKAKLIGTLNGYLTSPVTVSDMDLTLIARFPQASIHLHDVLAREARADSLPADTLLFAQDLFLEFSLMDLFRGNYRVQQVHGEGVKLHPGLDAEGRQNWVIWETDSTSTEGDFTLERVTLDELIVRYRDARSGLEVLTASRHLQLGGTLSAAGNDLRLKGDAHLLHWSDDADIVLSDRMADLKLEMVFGGKDDAFRITKGELLLGGPGSGSGMTPIALTMSVVPGDKGDVLDLRANGLGLGLAEVVQLLPDAVKKPLDRYGMDGAVDLALSYKGPIAEGPSLSVGMTLRDGRMKERVSGITMKAITGECAFDLSPKGDLSRLLVKSFSAQAASGTISGSWDMKGQANTPLKAHLSGDIALADLLHFARVDTLEQVAGRLTADVHIDGRVRDVSKVKASDLRALTITGTAQLKDATLKLKGIRHTVTGLDADLKLEGNDAQVRSLHGALQGNELALTGELRNLMPYLLFEDQALFVAAQGSSPRIDLGSLLSRVPVADGPADPHSTGGYALKLPALIQLDLQAKVDELVFEDFRATDISGTISMKDRVLKASPVVFNTASGGVVGTLSLDARGRDAYPLAIDASVKDIDVQQLFSEFQEFGQSFITSHHLSGRANAQVTFASPLSPVLQLDLDQLRCVVDIAIENGGIRQHQPLMDVATYVKENKLIAPWVDSGELRARLADVRFERLENRVEIRDRQVVIPAMLVQSNAMDIELSGTHGFDDQIDHHINFRLSDLFRNGTPEDEFGPVVDDGTGLRVFLHMYGLASAPQFENDGAMAARRRSAQVKEQTAELRSILHNELNLFGRKEEAAPPVTSTDPPPQFQVEWSEGDTARSEVKPKKKKGLGRLFQEEEAEKEVIQIDQ